MRVYLLNPFHRKKRIRNLPQTVRRGHLAEGMKEVMEELTLQFLSGLCTAE